MFMLLNYTTCCVI